MGDTSWELVLLREGVETNAVKAVTGREHNNFNVLLTVMFFLGQVLDLLVME